MRHWNKTPLIARSTPGFIVNRIARPFYAEALALLEEGRATPSELDCCLRAAGFRMGPCELMDLIGHDVNLAVTESVYAATYSDKRFVPSVVQREMVDGRWLGRKSGKGFYDYTESVNAPVINFLETNPDSIEMSHTLHGSGPVADALSKRFEGAHIPLARGNQFSRVRLHISAGDALSIVLTPTDGRTAAQLSWENDGHWGVFDWFTTQSARLRLAASRACVPSSSRMRRDSL